MLVPALLVMLANTTYWWPPPGTAPLFRAWQLPALTPLPDTTVPSPPCSFLSGYTEGYMVAREPNATVICRSVAPGLTANQSFSLVNVTYAARAVDAGGPAWTTTPLPFPAYQPLLNQANLRFTSDPNTGTTWILTPNPLAAPSGPASGGGTAGNGGGPPILYSYGPNTPPPDPLGPPLEPVYNGTGGFTLQDIQLSPGLGLFASAMWSPPAPGVGLLQRGIVAWPPDRLPLGPGPGDPPTWLPGTNSSRTLLAFLAPTLRTPLYIMSVMTTAPTSNVLEGWALDAAKGVWSPTFSRTVTSFPVGQPVHQMLYDAPTNSMIVLSNRVLSVVSLGPTTSDRVVVSLASTVPLAFRSMSRTVVSVMPSGSATASASVLPTASSTASASATATGSSSATATGTAAASSTGTASATETATVAATASPLPTIVNTWWPTPSAAPTVSAASTPSPVTYPSLSASSTPTPTASVMSSPSNGTAPVPPAAMAAADSPEVAYGVGFGLGVPLGIAAIAMALWFQKDALCSMYNKAKAKRLATVKRVKHPPRRPYKPGATAPKLNPLGTTQAQASMRGIAHPSQRYMLPSQNQIQMSQNPALLQARMQALANQQQLALDKVKQQFPPRLTGSVV